jgi:hypothetical protein
LTISLKFEGRAALRSRNPNSFLFTVIIRGLTACGLKCWKISDKGSYPPCVRGDVAKSYPPFWNISEVEERSTAQTVSEPEGKSELGNGG